MKLKYIYVHICIKFNHSLTWKIDKVGVYNIIYFTLVVSKLVKYLQNLYQISLFTFTVENGFLNLTWKSQNVCWINTGSIVGHRALY